MKKSEFLVIARLIDEFEACHSASESKDPFGAFANWLYTTKVITDSENEGDD